MCLPERNIKMRHTMKSTLAAIALLIAPLSYADGLTSGENLITQFGPEFSDYDKYRPFTMDEHDNYTQLWRSIERGFSDHYSINIVNASGKTLDGFKTAQAEQIERICLSHHSTPVEHKVINGYQAISWQNSCEQEKLTITSIELAIMGNESFYHLRKLWKIPVTNDKVTEWQALLSQTSICDTTQKQHSCPAE